jgi:UDP-N-acetylglucosamine diphosphorylase/glucosamine-1-phosphate N-acetyltransferase
MIIILFDTGTRQNLYPLIQTQAVSDLRYGIFSAKERWELISGLPVYVHTEPYLMCRYDTIPQDEYLWIDASVKDDPALRSRILSLQTGEALTDEKGLIAGRNSMSIKGFDVQGSEKYFDKISLNENVARLELPWQIFQWNDDQLRKDFLLIFSRTTTQPVPATNSVIQPENIIMEEGATAEYCIINASAGPVYIGKNATLMEGSIIRGPAAICDGAVVKAGTRIYGATTIGPFCTVGGEIKNTVLQSNSNKAHDGYLGDSVIGSWCNLGAGTSNSNVKNTGSEINVWHRASDEFINVGAKCGVIMGDYSRTAINTSINTGSVIGTCCNIFGEGLTPHFIPDFNWGTKNVKPYQLENCLQDINNWKKMKRMEITEEEVSVLRYIFEHRDTKLPPIRKAQVNKPTARRSVKRSKVSKV